MSKIQLAGWLLVGQVVFIAAWGTWALWKMHREGWW